MSKRLTTAEFIERSSKAHNCKYDYSKSIYVKNSDKLVVICPTHGEFLIRAHGHMSGKGCLSCAVEKRSALRLLSNDDFIKKSKLVHGEKYDYSETVYTKAKERVKIICRTHGAFYQIAYEHMKGSDCKLCSARKVLASAFIHRSMKIHNNKYLYPDTGYYNHASNVKIICPVHGEFAMNARSHIRGHGCQKCSSHNLGWGKSKYVDFCTRNYNGKAFLYVIKINNTKHDFFKIGISAHGYKRRYRFQKRNLNISKVFEVKGCAKKIWEIEKILHKMCKGNEIDFTSGLRGGDTECFVKIDVELLRDRISNYFSGDLLWL